MIFGQFWPIFDRFWPILVISEHFQIQVIFKNRCKDLPERLNILIKLFKILNQIYFHLPILYLYRNHQLL